MIHAPKFWDTTIHVQCIFNTHIYTQYIYIYIYILACLPGFRYHLNTFHFFSCATASLVHFEHQNISSKLLQVCDLPMKMEALFISLLDSISIPGILILILAPSNYNISPVKVVKHDAMKGIYWPKRVPKWRCSQNSLRKNTTFLVRLAAGHPEIDGFVVCRWLSLFL